MVLVTTAVEIGAEIEQGSLEVGLGAEEQICEESGDYSVCGWEGTDGVERLMAWNW
ncbi:MAG: hypothetical protein ACYTEL_19480 [Planctomycetota bacterium]